MKIGNLSLENPVFLAPMAGITDPPFRKMVREYGCGLAFTEMISANGIVRKTDNNRRYITSFPGDRPLGVQIFGADPSILAEAARIVTGADADLIDINMGCPVKKVVKTGAGVALMGNPDRVSEILRSVRKATPLPLTVKIRSGFSSRSITAVQIAQIAQDCGVDAVIIHSRTADQGLIGNANWEIIKEVKEYLRIPVVGNGDIKEPDDARRVIALTGCDAVMVGRGVLGKPWNLKNIISYLEGRDKHYMPSLLEREEIIKCHLEMSILYAGEKHGIMRFRKHLLWYINGFKGGAHCRRILSNICDKKSLLEEIHLYFQTIHECYNDKR
jgi:nifR3 family TIM-barrel protein